MLREDGQPRAGLARLEVLLVTAAGVTLIGLGLMSLAGCSNRSSETKPDTERDGENMLERSQRIRCSNNLRQVGFAMLFFAEIGSQGFPSDQRQEQQQAGRPSFYSQILEDCDYGSFVKQGGELNQDSPAPLFVCPGRRPAEHVPGAADYGYLASSASGGSILDDRAGVQSSAIASELSATALLSHIWLSPTKYALPEPKWASPTGHAATKGERGYEDIDDAGTGSLGSPHRGGMPCVFADGHVAILPYQHPQFALLWNYTDGKTRRINVPGAKEPEQPRRAPDPRMTNPGGTFRSISTSRN